MANANQSKQQSNQRGSQQPDKGYVDETDSPLEAAKMDPFIKKCLSSCQFIQLFAGFWTMLYLFGVWTYNREDIMDMVLLLLIFGPPVLSLCFIKIQKTARRRED